ncbi:Holliday junction resolvase RuvX [Cellvibrio mixtus]|jgi:putative Holliday junction resolvase|uniref:Putative pre-16S rRNA nuclease n=1 Tax=Cellvibrio mixtus TaxID=39650 RepID=A0A266QD89_9GAMM|nr:MULTISPECIES: Holliday junction resolvase RuvX [Cellvibrio]AQT61319.1 Holliday junction resolvase RuvX [Cellvibrio sp. PSBB023]OZY87606.1 Holliday junction resolvase RuvX [Cellvibrio mixtus]
MTIKSLLAFDYGTKNIGVASGQTITRSANAQAQLKAKDGVPDWNQIEKLLKEWQPDLVLVGLPLNMDGSESELSTRARKFANRLHGRFGVKVELVDERLSSFEAKGEVMEQGGSRHYKLNPVDSIAARLILESWFERN